MRPGFRFLRAVYHKWETDNARLLGAALAYYAVFSIAPLMIVSLAVAGMVFGEQAAEGELIDQIRFFVGTSGAEAITRILQNVKESDMEGWAALVGGVVLLVSASALFHNLQLSLNIIWGVEDHANESWKKTITKRITSFAMVFLVGVLMVASILAGAVLSNINTRLGPILAFNIPSWQIANLLLSFLAMTVLFAIIFRYLPDVRIRNRDAWPGAALTATLMALGKHVIGIYLGHSNVTSPFGAMGSLAVLMIWAFYSAQIFLFGAIFTRMTSRLSHVKVPDQAIADQPGASLPNPS